MQPDKTGRCGCEADTGTQDLQERAYHTAYLGEVIVNAFAGEKASLSNM